jgi:hypothetical protein
VSEVKDFGLLCDLPASEDLVALMPLSHAPPAPQPGAALPARVLDVDKEMGSADISAAPGAQAGGKKDAKKAAALKAGDKVGGRWCWGVTCDTCCAAWSCTVLCWRLVAPCLLSWLCPPSTAHCHPHWVVRNQAFIATAGLLAGQRVSPWRCAAHCTDSPSSPISSSPHTGGGPRAAGEGALRGAQPGQGGQCGGLCGAQGPQHSVGGSGAAQLRGGPGGGPVGGGGGGVMVVVLLLVLQVVLVLPVLAALLVRMFCCILLDFAASQGQVLCTPAATSRRLTAALICLPQVVEATVQVLPAPETGGRLLLHVPLSTAAGIKRAAGSEAAGPAGTVSATVAAVHEMHLDLQVGGPGCVGGCCVCREVGAAAGAVDSSYAAAGAVDSSYAAWGSCGAVTAFHCNWAGRCTVLDCASVASTPVQQFTAVSLQPSLQPSPQPSLSPDPCTACSLLGPQVGQKLRGRLHITEVADPPAAGKRLPAVSPLAAFTEGQRLQVGHPALLPCCPASLLPCCPAALLPCCSSFQVPVQHCCLLLAFCAPL